MTTFKRFPFKPLASGAVLLVGFTALVWIIVIPEPARPGAPSQLSLASAEAEVIRPVLHEYIEIERGCGPYYEGEECAYVRAGPGFEYKIIGRLRKGIVLKIDETVLDEPNIWYRIVYDEPLRYPERVAREQYVLASDARHFYADGVQELSENAISFAKHIIVDRSDQKLYAYNGDELFMEVNISTGIQLTPTPRGIFRVYKKTPTRYMQGPLPGISEKYYDLPGVPWNLYFTNEGGVIHGAYWHDKFGQPWSNGCVNLPLDDAERLYEWAEIGTSVLVRD